METKIPATRHRLVQMGNVIKNRSVSIFEAAGFMEEKRANKAALILKRALHPDTVLFEFNANTLEKEEAYGIITQQVGRTHGFRPISDFRPGNRGNLLIEAKFIDKQDASKHAKMVSPTRGFNTAPHLLLKVRRKISPG